MSSLKFLKCFMCIAFVSGMVVLAGLGFIYSGYYPMGADSKHTKLTYDTDSVHSCTLHACLPDAFDHQVAAHAWAFPAGCQICTGPQKIGMFNISGPSTTAIIMSGVDWLELNSVSAGCDFASLQRERQVHVF